MTLKSEIINDAYSQLRISGLTVSPSAEDADLALSRLEDMMAEIPIDIGYNFEESPSASSDTGVRREFHQMMKTNLAVRLIPDFNKQAPPSLAAQASQSMSTAIGKYMVDTARQVLPPGRMPRGSGSRYSFGFSDRYQHPSALPPNEKETNRIWEGEKFEYYEDFSAWLQGNTISSFTIESDDRLTVTGQTNNDPRIDYIVEAVDGTEILQRVQITVTDSAGRKDIRIINFQVTEPPEIG